jgi:hypothetical protein
MGSPFKMSPKTPFMKALVGKQKNLPEHLKQAILDAPAKKTDKYKDVTIDKTSKEVKRKKGGGKDIITTETYEKGGSIETFGTTEGYRKGEGRIHTRQKRKMKGTGGEGAVVAGTTKAAGSAGYRTTKDGKKVVEEKTASEIKKRGYTTGKKSAGKSALKMTDKKKKETAGQKKYREAMERIAAQTAASAKRKKEGPKKGIRIKMGMGTSFKETRIGGSPNKMYGKKK